MTKHFWLSLFAFCFSGTVFAEVYQWIDENGGRHYSDRPNQRSEIVEIHPGYTFYLVKHVFDGDTILLENGRKIRLLGINTPEVAGRNKHEEPGGEEAKRWLAQRLGGQKIRLETDVEKKDKYDRLLAHVFTESGRHLNLELVENGLATVNIYPPNLRYTKALLQAEERAEQAGIGLWSNPYYARHPFKALPNRKGWQRVVGTIKRIKRTRKNNYLIFSDGFSIKIAKQDQQYFSDLTSYQGKHVEVRGWLRKSRNGHTVRVRHPGHIKFIEE